MQYNFHEIVAGAYPDLNIDYTKLLLSKGELKPAQYPIVETVPEGIRFSWDTNPQMPWPESSDQAMMLAYFPGEKKSGV